MSATILSVSENIQNTSNSQSNFSNELREGFKILKEAGFEYSIYVFQ